MAKTGAAAVRKQIVVEAPIERAFTVFTDRFGDFKPPEHNLLGAAIAETVFEPRVGGCIVDRATDGSECRWARIPAYDPAGPGGIQLGHQPAVDHRGRPRPDERGRGPLLRRVVGPDPGGTRAPAHRPARPGREAVTEGIGGPEGWPLYLDRCTALLREER